MIESLEERTVLSTFTVLNANDSGAGSLRAAILSVNQDTSNLGVDEIDFKLAATAAKTIYLKTELPALTHSVFIKGSSQAGYAGRPVITLNGSRIAGITNGIVIDPSAAADPFAIRIDSLRFAGFNDGINLPPNTAIAGILVQAVNNVMSLKSGGDGIVLNAGAASTTAILTHNTITTYGSGDGIVAETEGNSSTFTFVGNSITCWGGGDAINVTGGGNLNAINLSGNTALVHNGGDAVVLNVDPTSPTTASVANNVLNSSGLGTGIALFGGSVFQAMVHGNSFAGNLVGIEVTGDGATAGQIDLGGGALGSAGGNDFRSFRTARNNSYAIGLFNVGSGYSVSAELNLFSVSPATTVADGSHDLVAGGSGSIIV